MSGPVTPRISLVIPAWNEARLLPRLLDTVDAARRRFEHGAAAVEVIVADNASTDATADVARDRGCRVVWVGQRRIASARNGGARLASAPILAFVDADSQIHPGTFVAVEQCLADARFVAGATGVHLDRWSVGIALTYAMLVPWVWLLRMDTGLVFCRRADFEAVGGYDERRDFAEDVQLLWDLRRLGRRRGQRLVRLTSVKAIASTRKFDRHGDWHYFRLVARLLPLMLRHPAASDELARSYWYDDPR